MSIYAKAEIDRLRGEVEAGHRREAALTETIAMVRRQLDEVDRLAGLVSEAHELLDADCDDAAFDLESMISKP